MKISTRQLSWYGNELFRQGSRRPILSPEPDDKYPNMWRVRRPDGTLTDMVNRTRAKEAAQSIACRHLEGPETPSEAPPMRLNGRVVGPVPPRHEMAAE